MKRIGRFVARLVVLSLVVGLMLPVSVQAAGAGTQPFADLAGSPYESYVTALQQLGVVTGVDESHYAPTKAVTRAQMAALIIRAMGRSGDAVPLQSGASEYLDVPAGYWGKGAITLANRLNIVKGVDATHFAPEDPVNYAQAATMLVRALGYENQVIGGYPAGYVLKGNDLGLLANLKFDLFATVNRAEAAVFLYNAVFQAQAASDHLTWSQSVFKQAASLSLGALPPHVAPGQQLTLNATVKDAVGNAIAGANVQYTVVSGAAQISGNTLTLTGSAPVTIKASLNSLSDTATIVPVTDLKIAPESFQANKGGSVALQATALANGQRVTVKPNWQIVSGPANVNADGKVTVTDYGAITVKAVLGSLSATASGEAVGKVSISGQPAYVIPGQAYSLSAVAKDSAGRPIDVPVTWSATGALIDRSGRLSGITGAQVVVVATAAGISDQVTIPVVRSLVVTPDSHTMLIGQQKQYTAKGVDSLGNQYDVQADWDTADQTVGIISNRGVLAGTGSGATTVIATLGSLRGQAEVRVAGQPARLSVTPDNTLLPSGGSTTTVTVKLLDSAGSISPVDDQPITLTLSDNTGGSLSRTLVLSRQGVATVTYTSGTTAGAAGITSSAPGTSISDQLMTMNTYQQAASYIGLEVSPQPLSTGGGVATVTATLRDTSGYPMVTSQPLYVNLSTGNSASGSLMGTAITIPAGQSSGTLSFISTGLAGTVQITGTSTYSVRAAQIQTVNVGPAAGVKIHPITTATPVTGLTSMTVQVDVVDANGVVRSVDSLSRVQLAVAGPAEGQLVTYTATATQGMATFQVPATGVGTASLTASLVGATGNTDTTTAEFVPGIFSSLRLTAQPATMLGDGVSTGQVLAEVVDRSGQVLTNVNPTITFRKLSDGGATAATSALTVQAVGGRAVLSIRSNRATGSDLWYATAPGLDTLNLAKVATNATSGDAYTLRAASGTSFTTGSSGTLVIQVVDQQGRVVTSDQNRVVTATYNIAGVTVTSSATTQNGAATFAVIGTQAASGTITFTAPGLAAPTLAVPITVGSGGTAYSLFASSSATSTRINTQVTIWVRVMDSQGNVLSSDTGRVINATLSGSGSLSPNQTTTVNGMASFTLTSAQAGTVTITFTAPGLPQAQNSLLITFTP